MSLVLFSGCRRETGLANPASEYCEENSGTVEIREDKSGGPIGYCTFPDGSECEEWAIIAVNANLEKIRETNITLLFP